MHHDADWARRAQRELRVLRNEWDPLGVFEPGDEHGVLRPVEEYDCLRDPLISRLLRGEGRSETAAFLRDELTGHFGLAPPLDTADIADRIVIWWESVA